MSIYNRKMFKRNARNALNQSAGVPSFQVGGPVNPGVGYSTFTSPLTRKTFRSRIPSGRGVTSLQPFDIARRYISGGRKVGFGDDAAISPGEYATLQAYQSAYQAGQRVKDPTDTRIGGALESVLNPAARVAAGGGAFVRGLTTQGLQSLLSSDKQMPEPLQLSFKPTEAEKKVIGTKPDGRPLTAGEKVVGKRADGTPITAYDQRVANEIAAAKQDTTLGQRVGSLRPGAIDQDYLTSLGIFEIDPAATSTAAGPKAAPTKIPEGGMAAQRIRDEIRAGETATDNSPEAIARRQAEAEARKQMAEQGIVISDEETGQMPPQTGEIESMLDNLMRDKQAQRDKQEDDFQKAVDAADRDEADVDLAKYKKGDESGDGASGGGGQEGGDAAPSAKEEIERVINSGTKEEQEKTLDGFIKEFMDKAPGYEGADSGLILAKIGFAMAAGKSENAIENIASAMSDGADMLIKDKAKRDEFDRQLKLSALQYGLQETGKIRAEDRLEQRERRATKDYVAGPDGATYNGREFGPNESIPVSVGDVRDGNIPKGAIAPATLTAMVQQAKATQAGLAAKLKRKEISMTEYQKEIEKYDKAVTTAITSEIGIGLLEGAMIETAENKVTGITPAIKSMLNEGANFFGMDLGKEYQTLDEVRDAMRASLQDLVPVTLGAAQSANSISNRDVDFLIEAYFGAGALNGGRLAFVTQDPEVMVKRLQRAAGKMRDSQKGAFSTMTTIQNTLTPVFQPGTYDSAVGGLSEQQKRLAQAGLSPQGTATFTSIGLVSAGKDQATGLPRFKFG